MPWWRCAASEPKHLGSSAPAVTSRRCFRWNLENVHCLRIPERWEIALQVRCGLVLTALEAFKGELDEHVSCTAKNTSGAAVSGCSTPRDTYNVLRAKSSQATTLQDAIWESRSWAILLGQETTLHLKESDPVLFVDGFLSYYRAFRLDVAAGQKYTLTLISWCEPNYTKKVVIPAVYVVDSEGRVVTQTPRYLRTKGGGAINGLAGDGLGLVGEWNFSAEKKDRYHLVITADNSRPGEFNEFGYANATGHMVFKVDKH